MPKPFGAQLRSCPRLPRHHLDGGKITVCKDSHVKMGWEKRREWEKKYHRGTIVNKKEKRKKERGKTTVKEEE